MLSPTAEEDFILQIDDRTNVVRNDPQNISDAEGVGGSDVDEAMLFIQAREREAGMVEDMAEAFPAGDAQRVRRESLRASVDDGTVARRDRNNRSENSGRAVFKAAGILQPGVAIVVDVSAGANLGDVGNGARELGGRAWTLPR